MHRQRGLTLLELLVVLTIIAFAMAAVSLSLRDSRQTQLEREGQRLIALLEAARAQSRTSGVALLWQLTPNGFVIRPAQAQTNTALANLPTNASVPLTPRTENWLNVETQAVISAGGLSGNNTTVANTLVLGPEPLLTPARITLSLQASQNANTPPSSSTLSLGTDGLRPFQVVP